MSDPVVVSAIIASSISLLIALIVYVTSVYTVKKEGARLERELQRKFTEKLYDKRLDAYPEAFVITDQTSGENLFRAQVTCHDLLMVRSRLVQWYRDKGFVMSDTSIMAFYDLRKALDTDMIEGSVPDQQKLKDIFAAKNHFRASLRQDVNLLYSEEREPSS
jgi:hypothetical protein